MELLDLIATVLMVPRANLDETSGSRNVAGWDSTAQLNLGLALEENYKIELTPDELISLHSVAEIRAILADHGVK
jgi:acyl carrier protein